MPSTGADRYITRKNAVCTARAAATENIELISALKIVGGDIRAHNKRIVVSEEESIPYSSKLDIFKCNSAAEINNNVVCQYKLAAAGNGDMTVYLGSVNIFVYINCIKNMDSYIRVIVVLISSLRISECICERSKRILSCSGEIFDILGNVTKNNTVCRNINISCYYSVIENTDASFSIAATVAHIDKTTAIVNVIYHVYACFAVVFGIDFNSQVGFHNLAASFICTNYVLKTGSCTSGRKGNNFFSFSMCAACRSTANGAKAVCINVSLNLFAIGFFVAAIARGYVTALNLYINSILKVMLVERNEFGTAGSNHPVRRGCNTCKVCNIRIGGSGEHNCVRQFGVCFTKIEIICVGNICICRICSSYGTNVSTAVSNRTCVIEICHSISSVCTVTCADNTAGSTGNADNGTNIHTVRKSTACRVRIYAVIACNTADILILFGLDCTCVVAVINMCCRVSGKNTYKTTYIAAGCAICSDVAVVSKTADIDRAAFNRLKTAYKTADHL